MNRYQPEVSCQGTSRFYSAHSCRDERQETPYRDIFATIEMIPVSGDRSQADTVMRSLLKS